MRLVFVPPTREDFHTRFGSWPHPKFPPLPFSPPLAGLRLPASIAWHDLVVVALAMSSGFTFALFTAATLLPVGGVLTQIRVGALATAVGAALTYGVARGMRVGRFAVSR